MAPEQIRGPGRRRPLGRVRPGRHPVRAFTLRPPFVGDRRELEYAHLSFRAPAPSRFAPLPAAARRAHPPLPEQGPGPALRRRHRPAGGLRGGRRRSGGARAEPGRPRRARPGARPAGGRPPAGGAPLPALRRAWRRPTSRGRWRRSAASWPTSARAAVSAPSPTAPGTTPPGGPTPPPRRCWRGAWPPGSSSTSTRWSRARGPTAPPAVQPHVLPGVPLSRRRRSGGHPADGRRARHLAGGALHAGAGPAAALPARRAARPRAHAPRPSTRCATPPCRWSGATGICGAWRARPCGAAAERRPRVARVLAEPGLGKTRLGFELRACCAAAAGRRGHRASRARAAGQRRRRGPGRVCCAGPSICPPCRRRRTAARCCSSGWARRRARPPPPPPCCWAGSRPSTRPSCRCGRPPAPCGPTPPARARRPCAGWPARRPVFVLLDDAHWADDTLLDTLEQATVSQLPLWVCALGRPAFADSRPGWGQRAAQRPHPAPRPPRSGRRRRAVPPPARAGHPGARAGGHPPHRARPGHPAPAVRFGARAAPPGAGARSRPAASGTSPARCSTGCPTRPCSTGWPAASSTSCPAALAAHARLLSVLEHEIAREEVAGVLAAMERDLADLFPLDAQVGTLRLEQVGLLARRRNGRFVFRNEMMREAVARTVAEALGARVHAAALAYHRTADLPDATRLPRLAWHAAAVGERREAAAAYLDLADAARQRHAYLDADLLYSRALDQLDEGDEGGRLRASQGRGIMRYRLARHDDSRADLARARELALRGSDRALQVEVLLDEAMALDWLFEWQRSRELAEQARAAGGGARPAPGGAAGPRAAGAGPLGPPVQPGRRGGALPCARPPGWPSRPATPDTRCRWWRTAAGLPAPLHGRARRGRDAPGPGPAPVRGEGRRASPGGGLEQPLLPLDRTQRSRPVPGGQPPRAGPRAAHGQRQLRAACQPQRRLLLLLAGRARHRPALRPPAHRDRRAPLLARGLPARRLGAAGPHPVGACGSGPRRSALVDEVHRQQAQARARGAEDVLLLPNDQVLLDMATLLVKGGDGARGRRWSPAPARWRRARS